MADKPLVLVIDDETGSRESMAIAIEKAGCEVRTFDDARRALEYLEEAGSARAGTSNGLLNACTAPLGVNIVSPGPRSRVSSFTE